MLGSLPTAQAHGGRGQVARSSERAPRGRCGVIQERQAQRGSEEGVFPAPVAQDRKSNAVSDQCDRG